MDLEDYLESVFDPFSTAVSSPKILDGSYSRTAGIKLRATGNITCDTAGETFIAFFPGYSNAISIQTSGGTVYGQHFLSHAETVVSRADIDKIRHVSLGLQLNLVNSADQNEGYWEAIRLNVDKSQFAAGVINTLGKIVFSDASNIDLANYPSYQTGKLRDLHRFMFKLNHITPDHPWGAVTTTFELPDNLSDSLDMIIIKITGRAEAASPSVIKYEIMSNQEVLYKEGTALGRTMTPSQFSQYTERLMHATDLPEPAIQFI